MANALSVLLSGKHKVTNGAEIKDYDVPPKIQSLARIIHLHKANSQCLELLLQSFDANPEKHANELLEMAGHLECNSILARQVVNQSFVLFTKKVLRFLVAHLKSNTGARNLLRMFYNTPPISRDKQAPWYIDAEALASVSHHRPCTLPGLPEDLELVTRLYEQRPVQGYTIKSVLTLFSARLSQVFAGRVELLEERSGKPVFQPRWKRDKIPSEERAQREQAMTLFHSLSKPYSYAKAPHVSFIPCWQGANEEALESAFSKGFSPVNGLFGKGHYVTPDADLAHKINSSGFLLVNWVAAFSPFPVIAQDKELIGKANFGNHDVHFVPVYSQSHPRCVEYHACQPDQIPQYAELVVFDSSQILPRYIVELQSSMPREPALVTASNWKVSDVCSWISSLSRNNYCHIIKENNINGEVLLSMKAEDWHLVGVDFSDVQQLIASVALL